MVRSAIAWCYIDKVAKCGIQVLVLLELDDLEAFYVVMNMVPNEHLFSIYSGIVPEITLVEIKFLMYGPYRGS